MPRLIIFAVLVASLAACSEAGPGGYGYAVNERPPLKQLSITRDNSDNPFSVDAGPRTALATAELD